ncbi:unnamed protein product, partial [Rotaria sordida]
KCPLPILLANNDAPTLNVGSGASNGIGVAGFELNAGYVLMILGWMFLPVYVKAFSKL